MKPADFLYHRPTTVKAALQLLAEYDGEARLLAGGQSLMPMMNMRLVRASAVIDINRIPDLDTITINDDGSAVLGALVRYSSAEAHKGLAAAQPLLVKAITHVGDRQVRNRGTLGGSLAQADPSGNLPLVALALGAKVVARSVRGQREIAIGSFFSGPYTTDLADDEFLTEIHLPPHPDAGVFVEIARRHNDFAVLSLAVAGNRLVSGHWQDVRIAIGAMHGTPVLAQAAMNAAEGSPLTDATLSDITAAAQDAVSPASDIRASAEYRRHLLSVHLTRALRTLRDGGPGRLESGQRVTPQAAKPADTGEAA